MTTFKRNDITNNGFTLLATSRPFTVNPAGTTIRNLTADALQGGTITVTWNGITTTDWVGIYTAGVTPMKYACMPEKKETDLCYLTQINRSAPFGWGILF